MRDKQPLYSEFSHPHAGDPRVDSKAKHAPSSSPGFWESGHLKIGEDEPTTATVLDEGISLTRREKQNKPKWDTLILNEGTRNEIKMLGKYYTISEQRGKSLDIWSSPPETRDSMLLDRIKGYRVFVLKDSEKADDPVRKGWAEVVVLEITPKGEKPKIKQFPYLEQNFTFCRAKMSEIRKTR